MIKGVKEMKGVEHISYFNHLLNLCVQHVTDRTPGFKDLKDKVSSFMTKTRQSTAAKRKFEERHITAWFKKPKSLVQDVGTCYNSTMLMFQHFKDLKAADILCMASQDFEVELCREEWDSIAKIVMILDPIHEVTLEMSGEKYRVRGAVGSLLKFEYLWKAFGGSSMKSLLQETSSRTNINTKFCFRGITNMTTSLN